MALPSVSVIVTTYNWPFALNRVLAALSLQRFDKMEVIIADDGSSDETAEVIRHYRKQSAYPMLHCWQPDEGFRAAMIRNKAVAQANHDYLVFIDGDCVPLPNFVANHAKLAKKNHFVAGTRILLNQRFTDEILHRGIKIERWSAWQWMLAGLAGKCNRFVPSMKVPLGLLRTVTKRRWQGAKTCNLGLWRDDFIAVNGFDENFIGWGFEDSDLVIRLLRQGLYRKYGKYAVEVLHLWHTTQDRSQIQTNQGKLQKTLLGTQIIATNGIRQYLNGDDQYSPVA